MRTWAATLADGSISYGLAEPNDEDLDAFTCGEEPDAQEVDTYFRSRQWFDAGKNVSKPPVYQFGSGDLVVGYAAVAFANKPHPHDASSDRRRYLVLYVLGVHQRMQGEVNPRSPVDGERYAQTIMRALDEDVSRQKDCAGLYLRVRQTNERAIRFYTRLGFDRDPGDPVQATDGGAPYIVMRKLRRDSS